MFGHDIIVIGASAGGVDALPRILSELPADLPASVLIVLHLPPQGPDLLAGILQRATRLKVQNGADRMAIRRGQVYVAPPDYHLSIAGRGMRLIRGPRENRHRPAIDPLFRSAARHYGPRLTGVLLTGHLDDGTAGLNSVKTHGGIAIVQDPREAVAPGMPESALRNVKIDHCLPLAEIGPLLLRLANTRDVAMGETKGPVTTTRSMTVEQIEARFGPPSPFICPECHGPLWATESGTALQFRCHTGHAFSPGSLLADHAERLERALWSAVRMFDEQAALLRRLAQRQDKSDAAVAQDENRARGFEVDADTIRKLLQRPR